jgi:hypothetical protein
MIPHKRRSAQAGSLRRLYAATSKSVRVYFDMYSIILPTQEMCGVQLEIVISLFGLVSSPLVILTIPLIFMTDLIFSKISVIFTDVVLGIDSFNPKYRAL